MKSYSEMCSFNTFEERFDYLKLNGFVGDCTFGGYRYLNQNIYRSKRWKKVRDSVIIRDNGCDLAIDDRIIGGRIIVHHINPLTIDDLKEENTFKLFNEENLVCVSNNTHEAIHYGDSSLLITMPEERKPNDTCPWR